MKLLIFVFGFMFTINLFAAENIELYSCEQFFLLPDNGMTLKVLRNATDKTFSIEVNRMSGGQSEVITYKVETETTQSDGYPVIFKGSSIMLKISGASFEGDTKKLATLITYEGGEPDSESMKCEAKSAQF